MMFVGQYMVIFNNIYVYQVSKHTLIFCFSIRINRYLITNTIYHVIYGVYNTRNEAANTRARK